MTEEAAVLGAGNMGTALAQVIAGNGHHVRLWSIENDVLEDVRDRHLNIKYLEGVTLHENIEPVWELEKAVTGAGFLVVSVPSQIVRTLSKDIAPFVKPGQLVLNVAKGLEAGTHRRMSEIICEELDAACTRYVGSMGGPAIAIEMARGHPLAVIIGIADDESRAACQRMLQNKHLKVEKTRDVAGLELCATLKNIYSIALGICDGTGRGTNTKAFLASLALDEMAIIVDALGGQRQTVYGLAGIGDLLTTGFSAHSRNRTLGEHLGARTDWRGFIRDNTVEGVVACQAMKELVAGKGLHLSLLDTIHSVLFEDQSAPQALHHFLEDFSYGG
jgi:glycerol-3-phosphate dehydrogenase (NAD(P)+)